MALSPGTRLGPYEILALIGAGGMGEVHRARDSRLGREVAIKVSHGNFSERFEREARVIAQLNHPHICTLHDVGPNYLVMELVEGETLSARLRKGPLPLDQVLHYGVQIAAAVAAAHAKGVIHRDLKPGNIMIAKSGIKVLDFGLAKSALDETITMENVVLGTPAYMSPEQREGKDLNTRSDIYALGLVLAEMATGKRPPTGELPNLAGLPLIFRHIVERCLAKDPDSRWQSAQDIGAELRWAGADPLPNEAARNKRLPSWIWGLAAGTLAAAAIGAMVVLREDRGSGSRQIASQFDITVSDTSGDTASVGNTRPMPSPDGRYLLLSGNSKGKPILLVRPIDAATAYPLTGTEGVGQQKYCWSPDGRWIAFYADGKLKKIGVAGGTPQTIANLPYVQEPSWGKGSILFRSTNRGGLSQIPELGGEVVEVTRLDASRGENSHRGNSFLPDGRRFIFTARCAQRENNALYIGSLDTGKTKRLMPIHSQATYVPPRDGLPGVLVYYLEGLLVSRRFDLDREELASGEAAIPVYDATIGYYPEGLGAGFSISDDGRISVIHRSRTGGSQLTWYKRSGETAGTLGPPGRYTQPRLSPDGAHVAFAAPDPDTGNRDVFVIEVARGAVSRLTTHIANDWFPVWSPDGKQLLFGSDRAGGAEMDTYLKRSPDSNAEEVPFPGDSPVDWSRDGKWISFVLGVESNDIWIAPALRDGKPFTYLQTRFQEYSPRFSPDTKWLAYVSNETGRAEVFVRPFTAGPAPPEGKIQISTRGGSSPVWKQDGAELYFLSSTGEIFAVDTRDIGRSQAAPIATLLFRACGERSVFNTSYNTGYNTLDGKSFLVNCISEAIGKLTVLQNWPFGGKR